MKRAARIQSLILLFVAACGGSATQTPGAQNTTPADGTKVEVQPVAVLQRAIGPRQRDGLAQVHAEVESRVAEPFTLGFMDGHGDTRECRANLG